MTTRTIQQLFDLSGKTALITGGSRGLGLQMAQSLGEAGAKVVLSSRKASDLEESAAVLKTAGIDASWIAADCAAEADITRLADESIARLGHIDILVNNAGAAWGAPAEDHPIEAWDKVMNLNIRGYFILSQQIAKKSMIARKSGSIINLASIAGLGGNPAGHNTIAYNTSKGAVINFTKTLAAEWGKYNIRVNAVNPGATRSMIGEAATGLRPELLPSPDDIMNPFVYLAADASKGASGLYLDASDWVGRSF